MYQALYRKWRPQTFDEVVGQEHITETLKNQIITGHLSHAYIFIGTRGTGKTSCARILAKAVNCEHPVNGNPCCQCPSCRAITEGTAVDVVELDAASNNGVDNVRALREEAVFSPVSAKKRVYIIDEVHMLSTSAFNALLKILEEPPEHLMFILATTELQKVPATILSRCQRHSFRRLTTPLLKSYIKDISGRERFDITDDAAGLIAHLADGGVRDALSLLDQCSSAPKIDTESVYSVMGLAGNLRIAGMLDNIIAHDTQKAISDFTSLWMDGKSPVTFLGELSTLLRNILMMHVAPKSGSELVTGGYDPATLKKLSSALTTEELLAAMETIQRYLGMMKDAQNPRTIAELCLISLCDDLLAEDVSALRGRLSRLEKQMEQGVPVRAVPSRDDKAAAPKAEDVPPFEVAPPVVEAPPVEDIPPFEEAPPIEDTPPFEVDLPPVEDAPPFEVDKPADKVPDTTTEVVKAAPVAAEGGKPSTAASSTEKVDALWKEISIHAKNTLPFNIRSSVLDSSKIDGYVEGDVLHLMANPVLIYSLVNRPDVLAKYAVAASEVCKREIRVVLSELKDKPRPARDINELTAFSEVKII